MGFPFHEPEERKRMIETLIVLGVLLGLGAWLYAAGKRTGSRKAYGVGRDHGRRGK